MNAPALTSVVEEAEQSNDPSFQCPSQESVSFAAREKSVRKRAGKAAADLLEEKGRGPGVKGGSGRESLHLLARTIVAEEEQKRSFLPMKK